MKERLCSDCEYCKEPCVGEHCKKCSFGSMWKPAQEPEEQEENMVNRKIPLPNVSPIFEHEASDYPDAVRVSFPNGRTIVYTRQVQQPEPMLVESIRIIRKWKTEGYKYTPPRRRRNQK